MKKLWLILIGIISLSLVSAQIYLYYNEPKDYKDKVLQREYFEEDGIYYSKSTATYIDYDNDDRLSTHDYRYGYTYRNSPEYLERYLKKNSDKIVIVSDENKEDDENKDEDFGNGDDKKYVYKKYFKYLDTYEEIICYKTPPKGKFIYRKCPE